ncbi:NAD(P)-dependent oxidoreductase [Nonomuraea sp. NN258]|uniref:NAD-dependent epimerase/dehydratase family protein n=1 Tax=Nonomuraea antri TaxID=2730852 RepID=UPI00156A3518|nr:NAD(P)-dependent oxidoreductase [Nonomuraea antri]NRQ33228.1 NAD(P)-dependent oxidoreductase [Nonomuraea antri]
MRVLLAGATGTLGTELVGQLLAAGHEVLGITRSPAGAAKLAQAGAQAVLADLMDRRALLDALKGQEADAVMHQATAITSMPLFHRDLYATDALRDQGTANLVQAAGLLGARRFVTQSFFLGYGYRDHGPGLVTEERPFVQRAKGGYDVHMRSMRANEDLALNSPGIEGVALRYGMFYGPEPSTRRLMDLARKRLLPAVRPAGVVSLVHVHDAASAAVAALSRGRGAYNVADDEPVAFDTWVRALARAAGAPAPITVPAWTLRPMAYLHALMAGTTIRVSSEKAKRELGWSPAYPTYREGVTTLA